MNAAHSHAASGPPSSPSKRWTAHLKRLLKPVLRPIVKRPLEAVRSVLRRVGDVEKTNQDLRADVDALSEQVEAATALGWDHVALARRLAALEDAVAQLADAEFSATGRRIDNRQLLLPFRDGSPAPRGAEAVRAAAS